MMKNNKEENKYNLPIDLSDKEVTKELEEKYCLSTQEIKEAYDRYIWHLEKYKELIERDCEKKVIKVDGVGQACPICKSPVNSNFCPQCGQRLKI
ncbi:hypothetical protein BFS06_11330 [Clostridium perfringens]|uniref:hypothetical protein n=1 Tax=Clostridium perfringens TaxID=1502 RepID=UPI00103A9E76|nr:hypothetical protein [Clostridium perfringens]TBX14806.1 hypothetical protein BFS06_11330 [Clostridium perfringens]